MPRTYRIASRSSLRYYAGTSLLWFGMFPYAVSRSYRDLTWATVGGLLAILVVALVPAVATALLPYDAIVTDEGECEFRSLLRRRRIRVHQIRSITTDEDSMDIRYDGGKVRVANVREIKDLLCRMVELNPAIKLEPWLQRELEDAGPFSAIGPG